MKEPTPALEVVEKEDLKDTSPNNEVTSDGQLKDLGEKYLLPEYQQAESGLEKLKSIFNIENVNQLSTDEYINLLREHPSDMLTHIIRQGRRDHAETMWHTSGLNEKHNGFVNLLASGGLKSVLGRNMEGKSFDEMVRAFCKLDTASDRFSALVSVQRTLENTSSHSNMFADKSSIHFASSVVMDKMYGGESQNEIFFVLPSVVAASNYKYSGMIEEGGQGWNNDVWLYADPAQGVELDSGFCFIPENAYVSAKDGSRYNEDGSLVSETISSKEYWEGYFTKVGKRPKHIIYYDTSLTPTQALHTWLEKTGIVRYIPVKELREANIYADTANKSELKDNIKKRAYELIDDAMPANDAFFEKVFHYEEEESQSKPGIGINLDTYLVTEEDRKRYKQYKENMYSQRFHISMDPDYLKKVGTLDAEQIVSYNNYLENLYNWQKGPKITPPPLDPLISST
jgi:hypothetical protein